MDGGLPSVLARCMLRRLDHDVDGASVHYARAHSQVMVVWMDA